MKRLLAASVAALAFFCASCSGSQSGSNSFGHLLPASVAETSATRTSAITSTLSSHAIENYLDPTLDASSKSFLQGLLGQLKFHEHELRTSSADTIIAVFDARSGRIYKNRPDVDVNLPQVRNGSVQVNTASKAHPLEIDPISTTTGAVRRVWTNPRQYPTIAGQYGFLFAAGTVNLTCTANSKAGDVGNLYFGGESGSNGSIDAGLQDTKGISGSTGNYEPYINLNSTFPGSYETLSGSTWVPSSKVTYPCGQSVNLEYDVETYNGQTVFIVATNPTSPTQPATNYIYITSGSSQAAGWTSDCGGCQVKESTSIAQSTQSLANGDVFGPITWSNVYVACGFTGDQVDNQLCGTQQDAWGFEQTELCDEWPYWDGSEAQGLTDCGNSPSAFEDVEVSGANYGDSTVQINLASAPASPTLPPNDVGWESGFQPTNTPGLGYFASVASCSGCDVVVNETLANSSSNPIVITVNSCSAPIELYNASNPSQIFYNTYGRECVDDVCIPCEEKYSIPPNGEFALYNNTALPAVPKGTELGFKLDINGLANISGGGTVSSDLTPAAEGVFQIPVAAPTPTPAPIHTPIIVPCAATKDAKEQSKERQIVICG